MAAKVEMLWWIFYNRHRKMVEGDACHGGAIGHNGMFIWRTSGLPSSAIDNTGLVLFYKTNV